MVKLPCLVEGCPIPASKYVWSGWYCDEHAKKVGAEIEAKVRAEAAAEAATKDAKERTGAGGCFGVLLGLLVVGAVLSGGRWLFKTACNEASGYLYRGTACRLERIEHPVYGAQLRIVNAAGDVVVAAGQVTPGWDATTKVNGEACRWAQNKKGEWLVRFKGQDFWLSEAEMVSAIIAGRGEMAFPTTGE